MSEQLHQDRRSRNIVLGLIVVSLLVIGLVAWRMQIFIRSQPQARLAPKPVSMQPTSDQVVVQTACFAFLLPKDFETTSSADWTGNSYARPRKYQYVNVAPFYGVQSDDEMLSRWRQRWLTLDGGEKDLSQTTVAGKPAWRVVDYYSQNQESFVTYLVRLPRPVRVEGSQPVTALEIRAWGTTEADRQLLESVIATWRWRL
jgi:hypothetical protein